MNTLEQLIPTPFVDCTNADVRYESECRRFAGHMAKLADIARALREIERQPKPDTIFVTAEGLALLAENQREYERRTKGER